jgi:Ser/Thr protein kinase RdoA (MazF antagonist)
LTKTAWGWNNDTFAVTSPAGRHILRISASADRSEVEFEHEVLSRLAALAALPFTTPLPMRSINGSTIELLETDRGPRPATVFTIIPGRHPDDEQTDAVAAGAAAFGKLDRVLATIETVGPSRPMSTDLASISRSVPTLEGIEQAIGDEAAALVRAVSEEAAELVRSLPRQLIHGDFALGNLLLNGTTVVGILDFEFCGHDVRAIELAGALGLVLTKTTAEQLWRPVLAAYLRALPLGDDERRALPTLTRLSRAAGLVWWVGRERQGLSSKTDTVERIERLLSIDAWVTRNADELVETALAVG